jgi:NAD(P)-dependent dehydrogenase (short-subunit alcohol dehydrogenase family)
VATGNSRFADKVVLQAVVTQVPLGRLAEPIEQAAAITWLASGDASYMTGVSLLVDGGYTAA